VVLGGMEVVGQASVLATPPQAGTLAPPKGAVAQPSLAVGKVHLICYVTPDMVKTGKQAGKIVGAVAKICGGVGGGPTDYWLTRLRFLFSCGG
jgi:alanyl-tRNA synthetase